MIILAGYLVKNYISPSLKDAFCLENGNKRTLECLERERERERKRERERERERESRSSRKEYRHFVILEF